MTLTVAINGRPLFTWDGGAAELAKIESDVVRKLAASMNVTPQHLAQSFVQTIVGHGGFITSDPGNEMAVMVYFVAQAESDHPDHPGRIGDYLEVWDFTADIMRDDDRLRVSFVASLDKSGTA